MAGVKGRSGRKGWKEEAESKDILSLSFGILNRALSASDDEFSLEKKAELASKFVIKRIPNIDAVSEENVGNKILIYVTSQRVHPDEVLPAPSATDNPRIEAEV